MTLVEQYLLETPGKMTDMVERSATLFAAIKDQSYDRILLVGSGTSYHSGVQIKDFMRDMLGIEVSAMYPFMVNQAFLHTLQGKVLLIGISQGGASYSTYHAMQAAQACGHHTASMAGVTDAFIDSVADYVLTVPCGEENAGAKTKGYYCTKLNLMLMTLEMAKAQSKMDAATYEGHMDRIRQSIADFEAIYDRSAAWIEKNKEALAAAKEIRLIAPADLYGDVLEGALKLLETLRIPVSGYEFEEFIHGIYNAIDENSMIFMLDSGQEERMQTLQEVMSDWTQQIYVIGRKAAKSDKELCIDRFRDDAYQTLQFLLPIQLMCAKIADMKGIDAAKPKDPQFHMKLGSKRFD